MNSILSIFVKWKQSSPMPFGLTFWSTAQNKCTAPL